jgi:hypothetical protein
VNAVADFVVLKDKINPSAELNACAVSGTYLYVAAGDAGLRIYDVGSNPDSPSLLGTLGQLDASANDVLVDGSYAYVCAGRLYVVDVSTPASPALAGAVSLTHGGYGQMAKSGQYVFAGGYYDNGISVVDVSTPTAPREVGTYAMSTERAYSVVASGTHLYVGAYDGSSYASTIRILSVATPTNLSLVGSLAMPGTYSPVYGLQLVGSTLYAALNSEGLYIIDVSNPASPVTVGSLKSRPNQAMSVLVQGSYAYVADGQDGSVQTIDISAPASPRGIRLAPLLRGGGVP